MPFLVGLILGIAAAYAVFLILSRRGSGAYMSVTEYWVYIPHEKLPKQDEVMKLVLQGNSPVGPQEGLLFSDIRLHIALILRSKNPHVFRPDLFEDHLEPTAELLTALAESKAIAKVRYLSEVRLKTDAHLQLLPYLAYAYCKLADGKAVYDVTAERLMTVPELQGMLKADKNARRPDMHLNAVWRTSEQGGRVETRGLAKKGLPELVTGDINSDERILVTNVMEEAAKQLWEAEQLPEHVEVESYSDRFRLDLEPPKRGRAKVRIMRIQPA